MIIKHIEPNQVVSISGIKCTCGIIETGFPDEDKITYHLDPSDGSKEIVIIVNRWTGEHIETKRL